MIFFNISTVERDADCALNPSIEAFSKIVKLPVFVITASEVVLLPKLYFPLSIVNVPSLLINLSCVLISPVLLVDVSLIVNVPLFIIALLCKKLIVFPFKSRIIFFPVGISFVSSLLFTAFAASAIL